MPATLAFRPLLSAGAAAVLLSCSGGTPRVVPRGEPEDAAVLPRAEQPATPPEDGPAAPAAPREATATVGGGGGCGEQLERVAGCLFATVSVRQAQPEVAESLGRFLGGAAGTTDPSWHRACDPLGLSRATTRLLLRSGAEVTFRRADAGNDLFEGGRESLFFAYTLSAEGCDETGQTTIELSIGGAP